MSGGFLYKGVRYKIHPLVRDLYKRILTVAPDYPTGIDDVREKAKAYFHKNKNLTEERDILKAVGSGRWYLENEIIGVIKLKKYRQLKKRYYE